MSWPWPRLVIRSNGFTIQWQPQRLTQEDQILDMEDQSEANTAVTSGSENLASVYRSSFSDTMQ